MGIRDFAIEMIWTNHHWTDLGGKTRDWTKQHHYLEIISGPLDLNIDTFLTQCDFVDGLIKSLAG